MKTGDRVNWRSSKDAFLVPGLVVKLGPKRVQIEVRELSRFGRDLVPRTKWVDARDLSRRIYPASVLREAMDMHDRGFAISVVKRLARTQAFPNGVFYGAIDGREATAPYGSADAALQAAHAALTGGGYETGLRTNLECYEGWILGGIDGKPLAEARREIPLLEARLAKLAAAGLARSNAPDLELAEAV